MMLFGSLKVLVLINGLSKLVWWLSVLVSGGVSVSMCVSSCSSVGWVLSRLNKLIVFGRLVSRCF